MRSLQKAPHETTARDFDYREQPLYLAESWGVNVIENLPFTDFNRDELAYRARIAAHFANIYLRMRKSKTPKHAIPIYREAE